LKLHITHLFVGEALRHTFPHGQTTPRLCRGGGRVICSAFCISNAFKFITFRRFHPFKIHWLIIIIMIKHGHELEANHPFLDRPFYGETPNFWYEKYAMYQPNHGGRHYMIY
jgi:hypothetical protein